MIQAILYLSYQYICSGNDNIQYIEQFNTGNISPFISYNGTLKIPCGVETIQGQIFSYQYKSQIKYIEIPNTVTKIGAYQNQIIRGAFQDCTNLLAIDIPDSVTSIDQYAFINCYKLLSINIPYQVSVIKDLTFYNCTQLYCISIQNENCTISITAFNQTRFQGITLQSSLNQSTCPLSIYTNCTGQNSDYSYYNNNEYLCVAQQYVTYYILQQNQQKYFVADCPSQSTYYQNEIKPYQCVQDCIGVQARSYDLTDNHCSSTCTFTVFDYQTQAKQCTKNNQCNVNQLKSLYTSNRIQCVDKCSQSINLELQYKSGDQCLSNCGTYQGQQYVWFENDQHDRECRNSTTCDYTIQPPEFMIYGNGYCKRCDYNYNYINNNLCVEKCSDQYPNSYISANTYQCVDNCNDKTWTIINDDNQCNENRQCREDQYLIIQNNNQCVNQCPYNDYYIYAEGNQCVSGCGENKKYAYDNNCVQSCILTDKKYVNYLDNTCVESCNYEIDGIQYFFVWYSTSDNQQKCRNEVQCINNDMIHEYLVQETNQCIMICPSDAQYIQDNTCVQSCNSSEASFIGINKVCSENCGESQDTSLPYLYYQRPNTNDKICTEYTTCALQPYTFQQENECVILCTGDYATQLDPDQQSGQTKQCSLTCYYYESSGIIQNETYKYCTTTEISCQYQYPYIKLNTTRQCVQSCGVSQDNNLQYMWYKTERGDKQCSNATSCDQIEPDNIGKYTSIYNQDQECLLDLCYNKPYYTDFSKQVCIESCLTYDQFIYSISQPICIDQCSYDQKLIEINSELVCNDNCKVGQFIEYRDQFAVCVDQCSQQQMMIQNGICVEDCTDYYAEPADKNQETNYCSKDCTYYTIPDTNIKKCVQDDQCPKDYYLYKYERNICYEQCPDKIWDYIETTKQCISKEQCQKNKQYAVVYGINLQCIQYYNISNLNNVYHIINDNVIYIYQNQESCYELEQINGQKLYQSSYAYTCVYECDENQVWYYAENEKVCTEQCSDIGYYGYEMKEKQCMQQSKCQQENYRIEIESDDKQCMYIEGSKGCNDFQNYDINQDGVKCTKCQNEDEKIVNENDQMTCQDNKQINNKKYKSFRNATITLGVLFGALIISIILAIIVTIKCG